MTIDPRGNTRVDANFVPVGLSQDVNNRSGAIFAQASSAGVGSATSGETTLMSYTLPPGSLVNSGDTLIIYAAGTLAANANSKTMKLYFGGTSFSSGATTNSGGSWWLEGQVTKDSPQKQVISWNGQIAGTAVATTCVAATENEYSPVLIKITGTAATANNDILGKLLQIEIDA